MAEVRGKMIRQDEAVALLDAVEDERTRGIAGMLFAALWRQAQGEGAPVSDFDLELFMRAAIDFGGKHEVIASVLDGDNKFEWPD